MSFKWLFHSPGKCSDFIIDNLKKLKNTCKSLCTYQITFRSYTFWNTRLATLTLFRREEKKMWLQWNLNITKGQGIDKICFL